jgi:hypothetical protein
MMGFSLPLGRDQHLFHMGMGMGMVMVSKGYGHGKKGDS